MPTPNKTPAKKRPPHMEAILTDSPAPMPMRVGLLRTLCDDDDPAAAEVLSKVLRAAASKGTKSRYDAKLSELEELLQQFQAGPLRQAVFRRTVAVEGWGKRAEVILDNTEHNGPVFVFGDATVTTVGDDP